MFQGISITISILIVCFIGTISTICQDSELREFHRQNDWVRVASAYCYDEHLPFNYLPLECYNCHYLALRISKSNIPDVIPASFLKVPETIELTLSDNNLKNISPGAFTGLDVLEDLNLSNNELTGLTHGIFNSLIRLRVLDISDNKIRTLDPNLLTGTIHVTFLNLSRNSLAMFDDKVLAQNEYFQQVNLSQNFISKLNLSNSANRIGNLDVSKNNLSEIYICLSGLVTANFSSNRISSLLRGDCSYNMTIQNLDLGDNLITARNIQNISTLYTLEYLNIRKNNLTYIPIDLFVKFNNLTHLDLSQNNLQSLEYGTLDPLNRLSYLDLSHNRLSSMKRYLHSLKDLHTLLINDNQLKNLDSHQLKNDSPQLWHINFDNNDFSCEELVDIIHYLDGKFNKSSSTNRSNIHGIACSNYKFNNSTDDSFKDEFINYLKDVISSKLEESHSNDFERGVMYNYFNNDFKSSNFYKYLESLKAVNSQSFKEPDMLKYFNEDFEKSKFYNFLENLRADDNSTIEFNKNLYNYFNKDFNNSNFVKYLNKVEESRNRFMENFENSSMFNYFNKGFENSRFFKYFEDFKFLKGLSEPNISENDHSLGDKIGTNNGLISVLIILFIILLVFKFATFYIGIKKQKGTVTEQVELNW